MGRPAVRTDEQFKAAMLQRILLLERRRTLARLPGRLSGMGQEVADWNDAILPGFYWSASTALNAPVSGNSYVGMVRVHTGLGRIVQELRNPTTTNGVRSQVWHRVWNGSTWGTWRLQGSYSGYATVAGTGSHSATTAVTFPTSFFNAVPVVVVGSMTTGTTTGVLIGSAINVTASGFTLRLQSAQGLNFSSTYDVPWTAQVDA